MTRSPALAVLPLAALSLAVALAALAVALGSERFGGLVPCALCLVERWPYRVAAVLAAAALLPTAMRKVLLWGVVLCMAGSVVMATIHLGVEQGRWPSPLPECAAPRLGAGTVAERLARMPSRPAKPCDEPTFLVPGVPVSMAAMNGVAALAFGLFLAISLARMPTGADHERHHPSRRSDAQRAAGADDQGRPRR